MVLERTDGGDDDYGRRRDFGGATFDVEEFLCTQVGAETGFGGGFQWRSDTTDTWSVGLVGGISGDAYSVRLQGRIGG